MATTSDNAVTLATEQLKKAADLIDQIEKDTDTLIDASFAQGLAVTRIDIAAQFMHLADYS